MNLKEQLKLAAVGGTEKKKQNGNGTKEISNMNLNEIFKIKCKKIR